tara:strand:+ start:126 stop:956 length:831 start_codon:yes stop_codon:yes gene_type:complete
VGGTTFYDHDLAYAGIASRDEGTSQERSAVMKYRVLIVDDDPEIARGLEAHLAEEGLETLCVEEGDSVIPTLREAKKKGRPIDLILLDIGLQGSESGFDLCPKIREHAPSTLVFFLTGHTSSEDQVAGLRLKADDYITKPCEGKVVAVKVKEAISRRRIHPDVPCGDLRSGPFFYDKAREQVRYFEKVLVLTPLEHRILTVLISRAGRPQKRDDLIDECWVEMPDGKDTSNHDQRRNVDVQIKKIRAKLKEIREDPNPKDVIQTHTEIGYSLNDEL